MSSHQPFFLSKATNCLKAETSEVCWVLHLAGRVVADDLLVQTGTDHQQLTGRRKSQARRWGFVSTVKHVELLLGVRVPQDHRATVRNTAQQGALQRGQPQVVDGLKIKRKDLESRYFPQYTIEIHLFFSVLRKVSMNIKLRSVTD